MLVETRAGRLFVTSVGEGPAVVLWHSLLCDSGMWREQIPVLAERFRVITIDAPGHGRSSLVRTPYTMDDCVTAAVDVLDAVGVEHASWVGLSWGGMVGMRLAARYPERVDKLVLMDTSARAERLWKKMAYRPLRAIATTLGPVRPLGRVLEPIFFAPRSLRDNRPIVDAFVETVAALDPESLGHAVEAVIFSRRDVTDELARIEAPTLIIVGAEDRATPPSESEHLAEHIAHARLVRVPDAGHLSALERPEMVNDQLTAFLTTGD